MPQLFDLLDCLIRYRERVVSKDDHIEAIWNGRGSNSAGAFSMPRYSGEDNPLLKLSRSQS